MANLSRDEVEVLASVDSNLLGFGQPAPLTQKFINEGLIEIEQVGNYWKARLTKSGKRAVNGR